MKKLSLIALLLTSAACGDKDGGADSSATDDSTADDTASGDAFVPECVDGVAAVSGEYTQAKVKLVTGCAYLLSGGVFIGDDVNETILEIEPGVTVYGDNTTLSFLVIRRGSKLQAEGTAAAPIVFTSAVEAGSRKPGDWGGIILNGRAPINNCFNGAESLPCEAEGEGGTGLYGGGEPNDSSGVLKYVRVEFGGRKITDENELNGIAFQGVGSGTVVDYIQAHRGADDGVEFFGGMVDATHVVVTAPDDDGIDWTDGWVGRVQFAVVQQADGLGDNGIEADNSNDANDATPRSAPVLSNVTLVGVPTSDKSDLGALLREGTAAQLWSTLIVGFNQACVGLSQEATFEQAASGALVMATSIVDCATSFSTDVEGKTADDVAAWYNGASLGNQETASNLTKPYDLSAPNFRPSAGSAALSGAQQPTDSFFESVSYIGAFDATTDWTAGWITTAAD
ncbi:MAG: hypothetical protein IPO67_20995 [Deltaproteobacteria bacterium]|nr:hypothetical protein [Deltaproteobacteria bacterium]